MADIKLQAGQVWSDGSTSFEILGPKNGVRVFQIRTLELPVAASDLLDTIAACNLRLISGPGSEEQHERTG